MDERASTRLRCTDVRQGIFRHERLVHFLDATGNEWSAIVDEGLVEMPPRNSLRVRKLEDDGAGRALIELPTSDSERIWVDKGSLLA
jgi:hypothetical protein